MASPEKPASVNSAASQPSRLTHKLRSKVDHLASDLSRIGVAISTTWNPNHRHDEAWEQEIDAKLMAVRDSHRFRSFAPDRDGNVVKWHIDGHDYFWALSELIDRAKESIMILDWWLSPELQLRRPAAQFPEWRLDRLLRRKAEEGVRIYIQVYKEVDVSMSLASKHTKHALEDLHDNIAVMRHPDHSGGELVYYYSHHEKLCIIDNKFAAMGGLDACFGRWDTRDHPLADLHPTEFSKSLFPGQDYNNSRIMDFQSVDKFASNELAIQDATRMPWHDTSLTIVGPAVVDLVQHFCERWNFVKKIKYKHDHRMEWLTLPDPWHDVRSSREAQQKVEDAQFRVDHPHLSEWRDLGRRMTHPYHWPPSEAPRADEPVPEGTCRVQVIRSAADWSHGCLTEDSIQQAYIELIREANHCIYIENQFCKSHRERVDMFADTITTTREGGPVKNLIGLALVERIISAAKSGRKFKIYVLIPEVPAFPGDIQTQSGLKAIMEAQYRSISRGGNSIFDKVRAEGFNPEEYISFWNLRSYDRINNPKEEIKQMEEKSGVTFHEAQVALARVFIGEPGDVETQEDAVFIEKPHDQTTDAKDTNKKKKTAQDRIALPQTIPEAQDIIDRFQKAAVRNDSPIADNIGQHAMQSGGSVLNEPWAGSEQEERENIVTELLYIHSKLMIVDDRRVICGSANLNDRSQKGNHDSEIAIVIEDTDMVDMTMNGKKYRAGRLATTWRRSLMREHLGLLPPQAPINGQVHNGMRAVPVGLEYDFGSESDLLVEDPLSLDFTRLWNETARTNRRVFDRIFKTTPNESVRSWKLYNDFIQRNAGIKVGHVANPDMSLPEIKQELAKVRGHLVEMPLHFLCDEKWLTEGDFLAVNPVTLALYI